MQQVLKAVGAQTMTQEEAATSLAEILGLEVVGGEAGETLLGFSGNDTIAGGLGNDDILGESGDDVLRGDFNQRQSVAEGGNDRILGGPGNDRIGGKAGDDLLFGGEGNDQIWGDHGDDIIYGGLGDDTIHGDDGNRFSGTDTFVLATGEGTDTIVDFELGIDLIGLANGLTFNDLSFSENQIIVGEQTLAILSVDTSNLSESDFLLF